MKNKFITHEAVMRRFEKKFPGISRVSQAGAFEPDRIGKKDRHDAERHSQNGKPGL